jgi:hypothetical protein
VTKLFQSYDHDRSGFVPFAALTAFLQRFECMNFMSLADVKSLFNKHAKKSTAAAAAMANGGLMDHSPQSALSPSKNQPAFNYIEFTSSAFPASSISSPVFRSTRMVSRFRLGGGGGGNKAAPSVFRFNAAPKPKPKPYASSAYRNTSDSKVVTTRRPSFLPSAFRSGNVGGSTGLASHGIGGLRFQRTRPKPSYGKVQNGGTKLLNPLR